MAHKVTEISSYHIEVEVDTQCYGPWDNYCVRWWQECTELADKLAHEEGVQNTRVVCISEDTCSECGEEWTPVERPTLIVCGWCGGELTEEAQDGNGESTDVSEGDEGAGVREDSADGA